MAADGTPLVGSIVALEGLADDALETQLRLLPTSTQILVLPSIQHYLEEDSDNGSDSDSDSDDAPQQVPHAASVSAVQPYSTPFGVRRYIRRVHAAASKRRDTALEFLRDDAQDQPQTQSKPKAKPKAKTSSAAPAPDLSSRRIVFLNGGTASSHALCIEAIRKHSAAADGSLDKAASLFSQLTSDGVAGLSGVPRISLRKASQRRNANASTIGLNECAIDENSQDEGTDADPITRAMRAADALDRKTAALQPSSNTIDLTTDGGGASMRDMHRMRPRSLSFPVHGELLDLMDFMGSSRRASHTSKASASTVAHDGSSSIWVRSSVAAGASGSEVYDLGSFNFMSSSFGHPQSLRSPSVSQPQYQFQSQSPHRLSMSTEASTTQSPTRSSTHSPTSTIFPISMRLDAIAAQSQGAASAFASAPAATQLGPAAASRGRSRFRPRNLASDALGQSLNDFAFPMPPRRAQSLERSVSQSSRGLGVNFLLLGNSRDTSMQRLSYLSDTTQSTASAAAVPAASSVSYYDTASIPDVPLLPSTQDLEKMARAKKLATASSSSLRSSSRRPPSKAPLQPKSSRSSLPKLSTYVDRGTDAELIDDGLHALVPPSEHDEIFEPVLPLTEDVVIYFDDGSNASQALDVAFQRCKGLYSSQLRHHRRQEQQNQQQKKLDDQHERQTAASALPETPKSTFHGHGYSASTSTTASNNTTKSMDDYDPFAPHEYDTSPRIRSQASSVKTAKPPTPAHTPPPPTNEGRHGDSDNARGDDSSQSHTPPHFHILETGRHQTALALHNALRTILAGHYQSPSASASPSPPSPKHDLLSYLHGMGSASELWTPLLGGIDLVLALGSQHGVQPELVTKITSHLDMALGSCDGMSRCGRLDVRYLMANAMQQTHQHLAVNSKALATLVLKQLDLYLKTSPPSSPMRTILLDYPLELMGTVLSLRQLVGRDLVQVASIIVADTELSEDEHKPRPGFQKLRASPPPSLRPTASSHSMDSMDIDSRQSPRLPPFMRANYLLTSAATDADVAAFVASVRRVPIVPILGRYSALSTATTAAGMSMTRSMSRNSDRSPAHSPVPPPPMPMSVVAARKPVNALARSSSTSTTIRHPPQAARPKSPAPSTKSQVSEFSRASRASQASEVSSLVSQPDSSWRSTIGSNCKMAATGLAPAPVVMASNRLVAKTIQVGRRREDAASQGQAASPRQPSSQPQPQHQPQPQPQSQAQQTTAESMPPYNDDDYDFDGLDDDDLENDLDMRRLMPLFMRDRIALLKAKEAAGVRNVRVPPTRNKSDRMTGTSSSGSGGYIPRRPVVEYQHQSTSQEQRGLQSRGSTNSLRSQQSQVSFGQSNDGKKARKWLGLA